MADAIGMLTDEHRLIEEVLDSLETFMDSLGTDPDNEREMVRCYADFLHQYVDKCHHGKEEGYLFAHMNAYGFSKDDGPVSAMLSEQDEGREHLAALATIGAGSGPLSQHERTLVKGHGLGYVVRIRYHLKREDDILFPIARHALPPFVMAELAKEFRHFDSDILTDAVLQELLRTARQLSAKYPPTENPTSLPEKGYC